ncbi:MAG TPA: tRNA pseudouridine(55) synthase TruB [Candidatus Dormibacteraeota bacterium]|nr:tRNA pseudouridine(55) synthase TruB [Candidatus Dormibacteraeota bacterium]
MASGILNVNKPAGPTSFAVVRTVRRLPGISKVGHGGTLDPAAEGVLPILVNAATRLADFIHEWPKTYLATVTFGAVSDTGDSQGTITPSGDPSGITQARIEDLLPSFTGRIEQVPPLYSALKQGGEPLYRKARRGETVERPARKVDIELIRLTDYEPASASARLEVRSGRGMYVRSLALDLGTALGCGAYLSALTRLAVGPLTVDTAIPPAGLEAMGKDWVSRLLPLDLPLHEWPALTLDRDGIDAVRHGRRVPVPGLARGRYRMLDADGQLVAWGDADGGNLQPRAVFDP